MKKIPTLFIREFTGPHSFVLTREVTPGMEWVLEGDGVATYKWDGTAVYYDGKKWYKRYDAKKGKQPPEGAIHCQDAPDPITGHFPHWVPVDRTKKEDRYIVEAIDDYVKEAWLEFGDSGVGTYEAIGPKINGNPHSYSRHMLKRHGELELLNFPRDYDAMNEFFKIHKMEGVVFWKDGEPKCKIKRTDFGYPWNSNGGKI